MHVGHATAQTFPVGREVRQKELLAASEVRHAAKLVILMLREAFPGVDRLGQDDLDEAVELLAEIRGHRQPGANDVLRLSPGCLPACQFTGGRAPVHPPRTEKGIDAGNSSYLRLRGDEPAKHLASREKSLDRCPAKRSPDIGI